MIDGAGVRKGSGLRDVDEAYMCGLSGMTADVRQVLVERGLDPSRIHFERFGWPA